MYFPSGKQTEAHYIYSSFFSRSYFYLYDLVVGKTFTLGKTERLKSRKIIEHLFREGNKFTIGPFRVFYLKEPGPLSRLQFAAGVSTKTFRKAVDRNRIKRLLRESWRVQKNSLKEIFEKKGQSLYVFIIYTGKELPVYLDMHKKINQVITRLNALIEPAP